MTEVPIYDAQGVQVDSFTINDTLEYVDGRVSKGAKGYYKGAGTPYDAHHVLYYDDAYEYEHTCDVFYIGHCVRKKCFEGKHGVFMERYQNHFTDWIGACGEKELQIVENLWELRMGHAGVEVMGFEPISPNGVFSDQYYLEVNYPEGRKTYLQEPNPGALMNLMSYMLDDNWNFPWDKRSISDITPKGNVTDVADVFKSDSLTHKVGSIYSMLYSLGGTDRKAYEAFCERHWLPHDKHVYYITNTLAILMRHGVNIEPCMRDKMVDTYTNTVRNYLVTGKNCGFCGVGSCKNRTDSNQSYGEDIRGEYIRQVEETLKL